MNLVLKRTSPTHHTLTVLEGDRREVVTLETKTYLYHDLLHFAIETEAGLVDSFYGKLARGVGYEELSLPEMPTGGAQRDEGLMTERIVGVMTGALRGDASASDAVSALENLLRASGETAPEWWNESFVLRIKERMRRLLGEWNGTPFGSEMRLVYPIPPD